MSRAHDPTRPIEIVPTIEASAPDELAIGELLGRYRVRAFVGEGAMGRVYAAWDESLARAVALKVMRLRQLGDGVWRDQFHAEARAMARVRHVNVMEVYGLGTVRGTPYLVMEYLEGETLRARLRRERRGMPIAEAMATFEAICLGTQAIHDAGVVHGDIKPANVLVAHDGRVAITDFGLARLVENGASPWPGSSLAGTPAYLAPERASGGLVAPELQTRADVYSLAVIAFELLAGERPFVGSSTTSSPQPSPPGAAEQRPALPRAFDEVLTRAMLPDPRMRPESPTVLMRLVRDAWQNAAAGKRPGARTVLVLDDHEDHRALVAELLTARDPDLVVLEAEHGQAALDRLATNNIDLVLADVMMPVMDGEAFVQRLRAQPGGDTVAVVMITGDPGGPQWRRLRALGVADLVPKPFDAQMLWAAVNRFLPRRDVSGGEPPG